MKEFLMPTIPKIIAYFILFFIMPTYYFVCANGVCNIKFSFFVIVGMLYNESFGVVTLPGLFLLSIISYLLSCFIVQAFEPIFSSLRQKSGA